MTRRIITGSYNSVLDLRAGMFWKVFEIELILIILLKSQFAHALSGGLDVVVQTICQRSIQLQNKYNFRRLCAPHTHICLRASRMVFNAQ